MKDEVMHRQIWLAGLLVIAVLLAGALAARPAAAQGGNETVTAQTVVTLPNGQQVSGSMVVRRALGAQTDSTWTFTGMLDGKPLVVAGSAVERWLGNGKLEVTITGINKFTVNGRQARNPDGSPGYPPALLQTVVIEQTGAGVITARGIPLAIGGQLLPPGSGDVSYVVTNAGQGLQQVDRIPNTSSASADAPLAGRPVALAALGVGALLAVGALALRPAARRRPR